MIQVTLILRQFVLSTNPRIAKITQIFIYIMHAIRFASMSLYLRKHCAPCTQPVEPYSSQQPVKLSIGIAIASLNITEHAFFDRMSKRTTAGSPVI